MPPFGFRPRRKSTVLFSPPSTTGVGSTATRLFRNLTIDSDLYRRGCTRTAFEFAKLLYSLDPWTDPHGSLFHLDGLAVKAGTHEWMLDIWEYFEVDRGGHSGSFTPAALPGWWYTRALAMKIREDTTGLQASGTICLFANQLTSFKFQDHTSSIQAFRAAVLHFPSLLPLLAEKADVALPAEVRSKSAFKVHVDS